MCFNAHTAHKICMGPLGFNAFSEAVTECKAEQEMAMRGGQEAEMEEDFCIFAFVKSYVDKKMCVMNKLGWVYEDGTPDYENVSRGIENQSIETERIMSVAFRNLGRSLSEHVQLGPPLRLWPRPRGLCQRCPHDQLQHNVHRHPDHHEQDSRGAWGWGIRRFSQGNQRMEPRNAMWR